MSEGTEFFDQDAEEATWENDVKVRGGRGSFRRPASTPGERARADESPKSRAQARLDEILNDSEKELQEARDLVVSALEDLALVLQPQHPNLPTLLGQQIEQVIQFRSTSSKVQR
jgi:hypothetical protein